MEVRAHSTPEERQALRQYLRQRRLTTSIHQTITTQTLNDLEESLRLLQGIHHPSEAWAEDVAAFLDQVLPRPQPRNATALPGLLEEVKDGS
jgi:hypothetical protein